MTSKAAKRDRSDPASEAHRDQGTPRMTQAPEPFGYWVEHKSANPAFFRKLSYIPRGLNYNVTPLYRAPTTLDEALRDYAMFGKFVADKCENHHIAMFTKAWRQNDLVSWPEFVNFVKEEMGK